MDCKVAALANEIEKRKQVMLKLVSRECYLGAYMAGRSTVLICGCARAGHCAFYWMSLLQQQSKALGRRKRTMRANIASSKTYAGLTPGVHSLLVKSAHPCVCCLVESKH